MKNTEKNAEQFLNEFFKNRVLQNEPLNISNYIDLLVGYGNLLERNKPFPNDAHSFEVFAVKSCEDSPLEKQAFIGFKLENGDFHFTSVPFTEPIAENKTEVRKPLITYISKRKQILDSLPDEDFSNPNFNKELELPSKGLKRKTNYNFDDLFEENNNSYFCKTLHRKENSDDSKIIAG